MPVVHLTASYLSASEGCQTVRRFLGSESFDLKILINTNIFVQQNSASVFDMSGIIIDYLMSVANI